MLNILFVVGAFQSAALMPNPPAVTTPPVAAAPAKPVKPKRKKCTSDDDSMGLGSHISMGCASDEELAKRGLEGERHLKEGASFGSTNMPGAPH